MGQKGRGARVWYERGIRPSGTIDQRHASAWLFGAVRPGTDQAFALVLTEVGTAAMQAFLDRFEIRSFAGRSCRPGRTLCANNGQGLPFELWACSHERNKLRGAHGRPPIIPVGRGAGIRSNGLGDPSNGSTAGEGTA
ncbi:hypothetical protein ACFQU7_43480 [Pseudoroseomonas wenyumeiae]